MSNRSRVFGFFGLLLVIDWFLYFRHAGHFFQADTIFLIVHRDTSLREFLGEFVKLHSSGWYRPLTNEILESILYPIFGLHPVPYRIPVYIAFAAVTAAVYVLAEAVSGRKLVAELATFFFNIHTVNAYVTFDLGFMPELMYVLFYLVSVIAYLRYVRVKDTFAYRLSILCFAGSLLSKEAAVTLPGILVLVHLFMDPEGGTFLGRFVRAMRSILPHAGLLFVYLAVVVAYMGVGGFSMHALFHRPANAQGGEYNFVLGSGIWKNVVLTLAWSFNIAKDYWGIWRPLTPAMVQWLQAFRIVLLALAAVSLVRGHHRKSVLIGIAWFVITIIPALPLVDHFIPYYVFLPVIGLALIVGAAFTMVFDALQRAPRFSGVFVMLFVFGGLLYLNDRSIRGDVRDNRLLGWSARIAKTSLNDLLMQYPTLPPNVRIYFDDLRDAVSWEHATGDLIKTVYKTDQVSPLYASLGDALPPDRERENTIVFSVKNSHLIDRTAEYRASPESFIHYKDSDQYSLELSANEVKAGRDKYKITIRGAHGEPVRITYTIDNGPIQSFILGTDAQGSATLAVDADTKKGSYRFLGFNVAEQGWVRSEKTIRVQ